MSDDTWLLAVVVMIWASISGCILYAETTPFPPQDEWAWFDAYWLALSWPLVAVAWAIAIGIPRLWRRCRRVKRSEPIA